MTKGKLYKVDFPKNVTMFMEFAYEHFTSRYYKGQMSILRTLDCEYLRNLRKYRKITSAQGQNINIFILSRI